MNHTDTNEIIDLLAERGFELNDSYLTHDICFDYDGCGYYPLTFHDWDQVDAFLTVLENYEN